MASPTRPCPPIAQFALLLSPAVSPACAKRHGFSGGAVDAGSPWIVPPRDEPLTWLHCPQRQRRRRCWHWPCQRFVPAALTRWLVEMYRAFVSPTPSQKGLGLKGMVPVAVAVGAVARIVLGAVAARAKAVDADPPARRAERQHKGQRGKPGAWPNRRAAKHGAMHVEDPTVREDDGRVGAKVIPEFYSSGVPVEGRESFHAPEVPHVSE